MVPSTYTYLRLVLTFDLFLPSSYSHRRRILTFDLCTKCCKQILVLGFSEMVQSSSRKQVSRLSWRKASPAAPRIYQVNLNLNLNLKLSNPEDFPTMTYPNLLLLQ